MVSPLQVSRSRRWLLGAISLAFVGLVSVPVQACDSCAASVQVPINTGLQVAQVAMTTAAVVAAIGAAGGGDGSSNNGPVAAAQDAAKSAAEHNTAVQMAETYRQVRAENTLNTQSTNCRLATKNVVAPAMEEVSRFSKMMQERGIVDNLFFHSSMTPQRIAAGALYRLCQNGQLAPTDFGQSWFTTNSCIDDPATVHDFLKISTILDNPVLIPPSQATMDILNNPEASAPAAVAAAWNALNDKQKKYVGATRYCENLVLSKVRPQEIRGDAAMSPSNMAGIVQNFGAISSISSARDMCVNELTRRVAIDPTLLPAGPHRDAVEQNGEKIINFLTNMRGADKRALYAYATPADYAADNPIPGAGGNPKAWISQYVIDRHPRDHGLSIQCVNYADSGTDAQKTGNAISCAQMAATWEKQEAARKKTFIEAVAAIDQAPQFVESQASPLRSGYMPGRDAPAVVQDAALEVPGFDKQPLRLDEMLHTMDAVRLPSKQAAAPGQR